MHVPTSLLSRHTYVLLVFARFFSSYQAVAEVKVGKDTPVLDAAGKAGFFLWRSTYVVKQVSVASSLRFCFVVHMTTSLHRITFVLLFGITFLHSLVD